MGKGSKRSLIDIFARHPVAANLLMLVMIFSGFWALTQINTQFLPTFKVNIISVNVPWRGASAEDVEKSITNPLEQELANVDFVKEMKSSSVQGSSTVLLEFEQGTDMSQALEQVRKSVDLVRNLPPGSEEPIITKEENFEPLAQLVITGGNNVEELRPFVHSIERELLDVGIAKVKVEGLPEQEIAIQVPSEQLSALKITLGDVAKKVAELSQDLPAGTIGRSDTARQLRAIQQQRTVTGFEQLPLFSDQSGYVLHLGDIATVTKRPREGEVTVFYHDKPAVQLTVFRTETADALKEAEVLKQWLASVKPHLPKGVQIHVYDESWQYIKERITLLLKNGLGGFILILGLLFLLLNRRVALWVAMGIPVSFMAALTIMYFTGGSINMVSLFAMIMALGIIVDDTIVVGEESLSLLDKGTPILESVTQGAKRMLAPVMSSSLTTICAFMPLLLIGDIIGEILRAIPFVVICIILASVIECFLVLPGHLYHSFSRIKEKNNGNLRRSIDQRFNHFRENIFRPFVSKAIEYRMVTLSLAFAGIILVLGLLMSGRVNFTFFPSPDGSIVVANVEFHSGTAPEVIAAFSQKLQAALDKTSAHYNNIVETDVVFRNKAALERGTGEQFLSMKVELTEPDDRKVRNEQFIETWRENIKLPPEVEDLVIQAPRTGPPGEDIDISLTGQGMENIKQAAIELQNVLQNIQGVKDIEDDVPYGQEQFIFSLKPQGRAVGLTISEVGQQLRAAFTGELAQIYHLPDDEIEVRVMLPDEERHHINTLEKFPIVTEKGEILPLNNVVDVQMQRGFDIIRHRDTKQTIKVSARVDNQVANSSKILSELKREILPNIESKYGVKYRFGGKAEEQQETLDDMKYGLLLALVMIYIILSWVFSSYAWPLIVMIAIPLGLVGAILGHWFMGHDLTILSLFGFFGLSGIVINDSIILLVRFKELQTKGMKGDAAIIEASCQRLRAVLLTSLTTIAGLTPLLFETSLQAQFLIPMAISITFGLAFATLLILVVVPALLSFYNSAIYQLTHHQGP